MFLQPEYQMLTRKRVPELMDDPALDSTSHAQALRGLERLNLFSSSAESLWVQFKTLAQATNDRPLRVLDIATGGGDIPVTLFHLAAAQGIKIEITGLDVSETAVEYAKNYAAQKKAEANFVQLDVLHQALPTGFDVVMTNLFTHHLDPDDVINLLSKMKDSATKLILVNDLVRSELSYALVWLGTRLFSRSPIVQYDGPVSVQGSYTSSELRNLAIRAGLAEAEVKQCPPCRQLLVWKRDK